MTMLQRIGIFEMERAKRALDFLLVDRKNEFREIANGIGFPTTFPRWEEIILKFCLDFNSCFKTLSEISGPHENNPDAHNTIHGCMTLMQQLARGKKSINDFTRLQRLAYTIAEEFKTSYQRIG